MTITKHIHEIQQLIQYFETLYHRTPNTVKLLAVSKGHSSQDIHTAYLAGITQFGESYWQEAQTKIQTLTNLPIHWHFIGPIQSNKTKHIANHFSWVHSVCRENIAQKLNDARINQTNTTLNICIQVNIDHDDAKSGIAPHLAINLAKFISQLPHLTLRGLMCIPSQHATTEQTYKTFLQLTDMLHAINKQLNINMDTLSMGMSHDMETAIRAGSTMVRIGRAIFGERQ